MKSIRVRHSFLAPTGELYELLCHRGRRLGLGGKNHVLAWHLDPVHPIWTKISMNMVFDPKNKPIEEFFIFLKIQDGGIWLKVQNRPNLTLQITVRLDICIPFRELDSNSFTHPIRVGNCVNHLESHITHSPNELKLLILTRGVFHLT